MLGPARVLAFFKGWRHGDRHMKPAVILSAIALAVGWHVMATSSGTAAIDGVKVATDKPGRPQYFAP